MEAATGIATHNYVPSGMPGIDRTNRTKMVFTEEGMHQFSLGMKGVDLSWPQHTPHHKAVVPFRVPYSSEPC